MAYSFDSSSALDACNRQADVLQPYRQGTLDGLCGLYAAVNAMRLATRDRMLEDAFWEEVFSSLILCTDAHVGIADVLLNGIAVQPLFVVLREVLAGIEHRFGRRFKVTRPFAGLSTNGPGFITAQLAWLSAQPQTAVMVKLKRPYRHWTVVKEVGPEGMVLFDSAAALTSDDALPTAAEPPPAIAGRATMLVERLPK